MKYIHVSPSPFFFSSFSEQAGIALPEERKMVHVRLDNKQSVKSFGKKHKYCGERKREREKL